jgi:hypothetical protein
MGQIVLGVVVAVVLFAVLGHWRRHHQDKAGPKERLVVGLLAAAGGVGLICLVVIVLPVIPAYAWTDLVLVVIELATLIAGVTLALGGVSLAIASIRELRSRRE